MHNILNSCVVLDSVLKIRLKRKEKKLQQANVTLWWNGQVTIQFHYLKTDPVKLNGD